MITTHTKTISIISILGLLAAPPLYAMGKQPDKKYNAAPRPASQTAAYSNPFTSGSYRAPEPPRNSNAVPAPVKNTHASTPDNPYGTQVPQGQTGISQTPGNSGSPATDGGTAVGSIGK